MLDRHALKQRAQTALTQTTCNPKRLLLIHVGAMALASLLLTVIDYVLQLQIDATGGLSGIATRSILSTAQSLLQLSYLALVPFWQVSYLAVAVAISRREQADTDTLFSGFHRFGPLLRLYLMQLVIYGILMIGSSYLSSFLYMLLPWGSQLMQQLMALMEQTGSTVPDDAVMETMMANSLPMLILGVAVFLIAAAPTFYRLRLSQYRILEGQNSALRAMAESTAMTKGFRLDLFKLDLSFWWFYALEVVIGLVGYADILLELAGIPLSWGPAARFFIPFLLHLVLYLSFQLWQKNRVAVTYAAAYEELLKPREPKPEIKQDPKNLPWTDSFDTSYDQ